MGLKTDSEVIRDNVNNTKKATLPLLVGAFAYRGVMFQCDCLTAGAALIDFADMVSEMRLYLGTQLERTIKPSDQVKIDSQIFNGNAVLAGRSFYFPFDDPLRPTPVGRDQTMLGTADLNDVRIEFDINDIGVVSAGGTFNKFRAVPHYENVLLPERLVIILRTQLYQQLSHL